MLQFYPYYIKKALHEIYFSPNYPHFFNQPLNKWNISKITRITLMFTQASSFNQDLSEWDVSNITSMNAMLNDTNLSTENYNALLDGWSQLDLQENVTFDANTSTFSPDGNISRQSIIDNFGWTINDAGVE